MPQTIQHPRFGEVTFSTHRGADYADLPSHTHAGDTLEIEVHGNDATIEDLDLLASFLDALESKLDAVEAALTADHEEIIGHAYEAWFDSEPEMMEDLFPDAAEADDITPTKTWAALSPARLALYLEEGKQSFTMDFRFPDEDVDYLIAAEFNAAGVLTDMALES